MNGAVARSRSAIAAIGTWIAAAVASVTREGEGGLQGAAVTHKPRWHALAADAR
jgi:hypothetical protein